MVQFPENAFWIGSNHAFDLHEAYLCFRSPSDWILEKEPTSATISISADSRYKLWINGRFIARGPNRCFPHNQIVDQIDISGFLHKGANTIAAQVYSPGYSHFAYVHEGAAGLLAWITCDGEIDLITNDQWRTWRDWSFDPDVPRISIYGTGVEKRDLRKVVDWQAQIFDDATWEAPRIFAPINGDPWISTRMRELPLLIEREQSLSLVESRLGPTHHDDDPHLALRAGWHAADRQEISQLSLEAGRSAYFLYDMGKDLTCQGWAEVTGAIGNESLSISYAEKIRDGEIVLSDPETYCRVRLTDRFKLRPGNQVVEGFTFRGGRYLIFQIDGPTTGDFHLVPHVRVSEYPLQITKPLITNDSKLDGIITICDNTFISCLQDGFVDSTWRESSQWLGDALPQSMILASMSDDLRPVKQVLEMAVEGAYPDGVFPSVLPGEVHAYAVVDYNFMWVELLKFYFDQTQDEKFVQNLWPALTKMLNRFHEDLATEGLIYSQPGRRLFLDWAPVSRNEPNATYNFRYLRGLQAGAELGRSLNLNDYANILDERARQLQEALRQSFWEDGRWYDDLPRTTYSQQSAAFALLTDTALKESEEKLIEAIITRSLDLNDEHTPKEMVLASPFTHHYIFEALKKHSRFQAVEQIIRKRWGRWVDSGYPTTWENWNVDFPDGSQCHAFSAHPRYHLAEILNSPVKA